MESGGRVIKTLNQNILYIFIVYNPPCTGSPARFFFTHTDTAHTRDTGPPRGHGHAHGARRITPHMYCMCAFSPVCAVIFTVMIDMYYSNLAFAFEVELCQRFFAILCTYYPSHHRGEIYTQTTLQYTSLTCMERVSRAREADSRPPRRAAALSARNVPR